MNLRSVLPPRDIFTLGIGLAFVVPEQVRTSLAGPFVRGVSVTGVWGGRGAATRISRQKKIGCASSVPRWTGLNMKSYGSSAAHAGANGLVLSVGGRRAALMSGSALIALVASSGVAMAECQSGATAGGGFTITDPANCQATATGTLSTAVGGSAKATGNFSSAFGAGSEATAEGAAAFGLISKASGKASTALGTVSTANSESSTAVGASASATAAGATALGASTEATGFNSTAVGLDAASHGAHSIAIGTQANASAERAVAIGAGAGTLLSRQMRQRLWDRRRRRGGGQLDRDRGQRKQTARATRHSLHRHPRTGSRSATRPRSAPTAPTASRSVSTTR